MGRLWDVATDVTSSGDEWRVGEQRYDPTPIASHNRLKSHRLSDPWGGSFGVVPWPTHGMRPHDRPIPAASWIIDPTIPAAS
jgi:hypothetical protein